ncbi:hypothetical protein [Planctomycetes bacterium K23_9]|uniref:Caspase domain protein n=1 Tax=Stieleria marina TaxID=1930275 RepID=A0A517NYN3_9BACT|nr:hypothetical protein K239x_42480 [Planctomycetes bacterium K23_9]
MNRQLILPTVLATLALAMGQSNLTRGETTIPDDETPEIIVVIGAEGAPEFGEQFGKWGTTWKQIADKTGAKFTTVGRTALTKKTDRETLQAALREIPPTRTAATWIILIGHGTYSRQAAKFNLRGPDVSAQDLAEWLQPIQSPLVIVNTASSSAPFINRLSGKNRVVVTATKSGTQYNFARFGKFFANAIASIESDLDHDDEVSVQEAFLRASNDVEEFYKSENRIATENALIDDNADSRGTPAKMFRGVRPIAKAKDGSPLDGNYAARITLSPSGNAWTLAADERKQRDELEHQLEVIRSQKETLDQSEYQTAIEPVMIQLAKIYQAAEERAASETKPQ